MVFRFFHIRFGGFLFYLSLLNVGKIGILKVVLCFCGVCMVLRVGLCWVFVGFVGGFYKAK